MDRLRRWLDDISGSRQRELLILLLMATMQGFLWTMMIPTIPLLAKDAGATEMQLGAITAIPALTTIISCIPGNSFGLRYGKRTLFIWSQYLGVACGALFYLTKGLGFLIVPEIIYGLSNMLFWPTYSAYVTEAIAPAKRASAIGYAMAASTLGSILSPIVAGFIIDAAGYKPVFILYVLISVAGLMTARILPKLPTDFEGSVAATILAGYRGVGSMLKQPILQVLTMNTFMQYLSLAVAESFVAAFLRGADYSATFIGTTVTLRTAATTFVRLFMGPLVARIGVAPLLFSGVFICSIAGALVPVFPVPAYVTVANVLIGAGFGVNPVLTSTLIAENTSPSERGMAMALDNTSVNIGRSTTGFGFGGIAQIVGFGPAITIANCFVAIGSLFTVARYTRLGRKTQSAATAEAMAEE